MQIRKIGRIAYQTRHDFSRGQNNRVPILLKLRLLRHSSEFLPNTSNVYPSDVHKAAFMTRLQLTHNHCEQIAVNTSLDISCDVHRFRRSVDIVLS